MDAKASTVSSVIARTYVQGRQKLIDELHLLHNHEGEGGRMDAVLAEYDAVIDDVLRCIAVDDGVCQQIIQTFAAIRKQVDKQVEEELAVTICQAVFGGSCLLRHPVPTCKCTVQQRTEEGNVVLC
jgi:hypothetical protein